MATRVLLKNIVSIEEWISVTKQTKNHCTLKRNFSATKQSKLQGSQLR